MANQDCTHKAHGGEPGTPRRFALIGQDRAAGASAFRVIGVMRETLKDVDIVVDAATPENARIKAEMIGVTVSQISLASKGAGSPRPKRQPVAAQAAERAAQATPETAPVAETAGFAAARWSSWPKILGGVSLVWGGAWLLGGVVGFFGGFVQGQLLPGSSSEVVELVFCAFMMTYGVLGMQAGNRLTERFRNSVKLEKLVWGVAFLLGLVYLFWPRLSAPAGIAGTVLFLVMSLPYPVFLLFWFSDETIKAQVKSWA